MEETELPFQDPVIPKYAFSGNEITLSICTKENTSVRSSYNKCEDVRDPYHNWWKSFIMKGVEFKNKEKLSRSISYLDVFSSIGGLSLAFETSARIHGLKPQSMMSIDVDGDALYVYKNNFNPWFILNQSLSTQVDFQFTGRGPEACYVYEPELVSGNLKDLAGSVDVVLAGPPCQGHSTLNNHTRSNDKRNYLYVVTAALISALKPKGFIIENVPNVVNDKSMVVESSKQLLRTMGYSLSEATLAADGLGWAQTRKRHFLIGSRNKRIDDLSVAYKNSMRAAMPVSMLLDLPSKLDTDSDLMFSDPAMSLENLERVKWLFKNDKYELPNSERPDCHKDGHTYPSVYGRMRPEDPAPTLTTGFMSPGRGRFVHPFEPRTLRPREAARIQGFPDTFKFGIQGRNLTRAMLQKWIGDAVPSPLGFLPASILLNSVDID